MKTRGVFVAELWVDFYPFVKLGFLTRKGVQNDGLV